MQRSIVCYIMCCSICELLLMANFLLLNIFLIPHTPPFVFKSQSQLVIDLIIADMSNLLHFASVFCTHSDKSVFSFPLVLSSSQPKLYKSVIEDVINEVRELFLDEGVDEQVLLELKTVTALLSLCAITKGGNIACAELWAILLFIVVQELPDFQLLF